MKSFYTCAHKNIPLISVSLEVLQDPISSLNSSAPSNKLLMSVTPEVSQDEMWPYFDSALVAPSSHCLTDFFKCFVIEFHNGCLNLLSNGLCFISEICYFLNLRTLNICKAKNWLELVCTRISSVV